MGNGREIELTYMIAPCCRQREGPHGKQEKEKYKKHVEGRNEYAS